MVRRAHTDTIRLFAHCGDGCKRVKSSASGRGGGLAAGSVLAFEYGALRDLGPDSVTDPNAWGDVYEAPKRREARSRVGRVQVDYFY